MRLFPRTARRRLAAAVAAGALAVGAVAVPLANADDDLKDRQKQVQGQIKSAHHDLDESSKALRKATIRLDAARAELTSAKAELARVRTELGEARVRDHQMKVRLAAAVERLETAQQDLENGRVAMQDQRVAVTDVITSIYQQGDPELLAFAALLDAQTTADLTRQMEVRNVIVGRETRAYDDLRAAEVLLEVREGQVEEARDEVARQRRDAAEHLVVMKRLHEQAQAARAHVREMVKDRRDARQSAIRVRKHDRAQLQRLEKQEQRIRQRILEQARRARQRGNGYQGRTGGLLSRPVPGGVTSPFGYREHPIYHYWGLHDGTDFYTPCGQAMRAVADGRVLSRYYSSVYGNRLVLGLGLVNGDYLSVIYNHATSYRVGVGATVPRGTVVGYAGSTGWSTGCHLHFTVQVNGRPVDPMNWM